MIRKEPRWRFAGDEVARRIGEFEVVFERPRRRFDLVSAAGIGALVVSGGILAAEMLADAGAAGEIREIAFTLDRSYHGAVDLWRSPFERLIEALD